MVDLSSRKLESLLKLLLGVVLIVVVNQLSERVYFRWDLTEEKRFTIKDATKQMLSDLDDEVVVEVFLEGSLNSGFTRLQEGIRQTLEEFRVYSDNRVQYRFIDPAAAMGEEAQMQFMQSLSQMGIQPTNIIEEKDGQRSEKLIFPGAVVSYGGVEQGVMLLKGNSASSADEKLNQSIEGVEYELASAIYQLTNLESKTIGLVKGHGELDSLDIISFESVLRAQYTVQDIYLGADDLSQVSALIVAKPQTAFSETEKYHLDQYLMQGGKVIMLIDKLQASMDSASNEFNYAFPFELNLDDQLFRYGIRINNNLVQDNSSAKYPIVTGNMGNQPQIQLIQWPFYPLVNRFADHPIARNINAVKGQFMSSVDTVKAENVTKIPLMFTSDYSRTVNAPVKVSIQDLRRNLTPDMLTEKNIPVAYLLEGEFRSLYENRFKPEGIDEASFIPRAAEGAKLLVAGDGDIARNDVNPRNGAPQPLGSDPFEQVTFGNQDFLLNAINFLIDDAGLITARSKNIEIRPLDKVKVADGRLKWQLINLLLPVLLLVAFGVIRHIWRKKKYQGSNSTENAA